MYSTIDTYLRFYKKYMFQKWDDIGPQEYALLLVSVALIGWILMRKAARL